MTPATFARGDLVTLPKRLYVNGDGQRGTVVHSMVCGDGVERATVERVVAGRERHTVVKADELEAIA